MNGQSELNTQMEAHLRAIWKGGSAARPAWTAEQVRARATRFGAQAGRLGLWDLMGFLLLPVIVLAALFTVGFKMLAQQPFGRIQIAGEALLFFGSAVGFLASRRRVAAVTSNANALLASQLERLCRLRDWYASTSWAIALYLPGLTLVLIGWGMNPAGGGWVKPITWAGVATFLYIAACMRTRIRARELQREIDSLEVLRRSA